MGKIMRLFHWHILVLVLVVLTLNCSSFRLLPQLETLAANGITPLQNYYLAYSLGSENAQLQLFELARAQEDDHWLQVLADDGYSPAFHELAVRNVSVREKTKLLQLAAQDGYAPSLHLLGELTDVATDKIRFLTQAAEQDYKPAQNALYHWLWLQERYDEAYPWLAKIAGEDANDALNLGMYLWRQGIHDEGKAWLQQSSKLGSETATTKLDFISKYWRKPLSIPSQEQSKQCAMQLQFVATSLDSLMQAKEFKQEFEQHPEMQLLPVCINPIFWLEQEILGCDSQPVNQYRISCRLDKLDGRINPEDFSHMVIFHSVGKANVVNGVMHLDLADTFSVFVHELAHFVGFVDEYPLSESLAEYFCYAGVELPNLVVLTPDDDISEVDLSFWRNHSQSLSLVKARTCNNHPNQAYKFISKLTFLEFHDSYYIPEMYLSIWQQRLDDPAAMRPAALNIAQALEQVGNVPAAEKWWLYFQKWQNSGFQSAQ